ncbi:MAG: hypothetical protein JW908_00485 [Anaerolineales bacterium]|nr:hypothetical protein [Anaerolineales bacterium]
MVKPRANVERSDRVERASGPILEPQFQIAAWTPDPSGKSPPEQVHFVIHWPVGMTGLPPMAIRFSSPDTLGVFIEELDRYRKYVWPGAEPVKLDAENIK